MNSAGWDVPTRKDPSWGGSATPSRCSSSWLAVVEDLPVISSSSIGFVFGRRFAFGLHHLMCWAAGAFGLALRTCALLLEEISFHL